MKLLKHKDYYGSVEFSAEDSCLFGQIQFISALVTYEGESVTEIEQSFKNAVEDYIKTSEQLGYEPEKPCKGSFNIRIGSDLHRNALIRAKNMGLNLNEFVKNQLKKLFIRS
jgi:predicted HicB family RNase H-like nuclease